MGENDVEEAEGDETVEGEGDGEETVVVLTPLASPLALCTKSEDVSLLEEDDEAFDDSECTPEVEDEAREDEVDSVADRGRCCWGSKPSAGRWCRFCGAEFTMSIDVVVELSSSLLSETAALAWASRFVLEMPSFILQPRFSAWLSSCCCWWWWWWWC